MPLLGTRGAASARGFGFGGAAAPQGQQAYTTAGTYSWVAPAGVTSVSVVAVGGGGRSSQSGGGGGLGYKNNIAVIPGNSYTVVAGAVNGDSYFINLTTVAGKTATGAGFNTGGTYVGDGGGNGGTATTTSYGGGGAGGYSGNGGVGQNTGSCPSSATAGSGGGGGGGSGSASGVGTAAGGGVGILGQGTNGAAAANSFSPVSFPGSSAIYGGKGGSGGAAATDGGQAFNACGCPTGSPVQSNAGNYGGGAGNSAAGAGSTGAVRIIWPGTTRQFPSTNTGDV